jgi:hypothetical protein
MRGGHGEEVGAQALARHAGGGLDRGDALGRDAGAPPFQDGGVGEAQRGAEPADAARRGDGFLDAGMLTHRRM